MQMAAMGARMARVLLNAGRTSPTQQSSSTTLRASQTPWGIACSDGTDRSELENFHTAPTRVCTVRRTCRAQKRMFMVYQKDRLLLLRRPGPLAAWPGTRYQTVVRTRH